MFFDGRYWVSLDRKWPWDGQRWTPTPPRFTVPRLPDASWATWIYRVVLIAQGSGFGCAGLFLAMIGLFAALGGAELWALGLFGAAFVGLVIAGGFGLLALKQKRSPHRWRFVLLALEVGLFVEGIPLFNLANYTGEHSGTPQNPGTDGPFADGGNALAALSSMAFVGGAVIVAAVLMSELALIAIRRLRSSRPT